jgi:hypothetical protein
MKTTDQKPEWSRARGLLAELKSATRRSLSAQILLGKELSGLKRKLGFTHGGDRKGSSPHVADLIGEPRTWKKWCESELQISDDTAARWVQCFEAALKRAKVRKAKEPEAGRLLEIPAAELTGDELELLAAVVDRLVDQDTQAGLLEELGIVKPSKKLEGGDTSAFKKGERQMTMGEWAKEVFQRIPREFDELERGIFRIKDAPEYRLLLQELPIDSPEDGAASLMGIKECLERVLGGGLAKILADVESAIETKMHGTPPKRSRRNLATTSSK